MFIWTAEYCRGSPLVLQSAVLGEEVALALPVRAAVLGVVPQVGQFLADLLPLLALVDVGTAEEERREVISSFEYKP